MSEPDNRAADMEALAKQLKAPKFDVMLTGDGAGSFVNTPSGWQVTLYERRTGRVWSHCGGFSGGTNNFAELEPFCFALWAYRSVLWAYHTEKNGNDGKSAVQPPNVLIVSDSEVTVKCGRKEYTRRANAPLWASIEWFEEKGYRFTWLHVPRNSNPMHKHADAVAKTVRAAMGKLSP